MHMKDVLTGMGIGAALAFTLDPNRGRYRRAVIRDKMFRCMRATRYGLGTTARDMSNRTRGVVAATRGRYADTDVDDDVLVQRIRAKLGRASSHPRAIDVSARHGVVTLRGPILVDEVDDVVATARSIRGVRDVVNELESHERTTRVPSLQGEGRLGEPMLDIMQRRWAPATRALVGASMIATGACLTAYARRGSHHHVDMDSATS
jgi:BON domain